ncbi:FMN-binding negative transcriptional regulator [Thorsellia anophelis]|uniref:Negative transcriptional regulator, PaiB family n=1 Tax=Thorsellia anophelis DSM 18579 TaxID=1123402 RepID=A0A1I0ET66_9GAMM|nr:FMN-binding negative transcriptional regulator [Thorsellia anophelis]SET48034.1 negative transcriptional regulator, PaiB family [Thorsellia anophelis DSM 18579]
MSQTEMNQRQIHKVLRQFAFGGLITSDFQVTYIPFIMPNEATVELHLAKTNPQLLALSDERVMLTVLGPHTYVSSFDYQTQPQVPTWNYVAIKIIGQSHLLNEDETEHSIDRMIQYFEPRLGNEPLLLPKQYKKNLLKHIRGVRVEIESMQGKAKLGLHKSEADQAEVLKHQEQKGNHAYVTFVNEWLAGKVKTR